MNLRALVDAMALSDEHPPCSSNVRREPNRPRNVVDDADTESFSEAPLPPAPETALGDFTTTTRVIPIVVLAVAIGAVSGFVADALLKLIGFFTNLFFFQRLAFSSASPGDHHLGY